MLLICTTTSAQEAILPRFFPAHSSPIVPATHIKTPAKIVPVSMQKPIDGRPADASDEPFVRADLPGPQRLFQRDTEEQFFDRIRHERKRTGAGRADFPQQPILSKEPYRPRAFPRMVELVEPFYVCHGRLYFEQPNFERTGYDFGVLTPGMCVGAFYYDAFMFPYHCWGDLKNRYECSVGKCLPGDQAPYLIPRERFSVTGLLGQSGAMIGVGFLLP